MGARYYRRDGTPYTMLEWARDFENPSVKKVAYDEVGDVGISTVWLGLNHQFGDGPPLIFETMVFNGPLDQEQERYSTEAEALAGHTRMVERVKELKDEAEEAD